MREEKNWVPYYLDSRIQLSDAGEVQTPGHESNIHIYNVLKKRGSTYTCHVKFKKGDKIAFTLRSAIYNSFNKTDYNAAKIININGKDSDCSLANLKVKDNEDKHMISLPVAEEEIDPKSYSSTEEVWKPYPLDSRIEFSTFGNTRATGILTPIKFHMTKSINSPTVILHYNFGKTSKKNITLRSAIWATFISVKNSKHIYNVDGDPRNCRLDNLALKSKNYERTITLEKAVFENLTKFNIDMVQKNDSLMRENELMKNCLRKIMQKSGKTFVIQMFGWMDNLDFKKLLNVIDGNN